MRTQPTSTSGRRVAALVVCMLLLGAASVGFDAATAHAATIGRQDVLRSPQHFPVEFAGRAYAIGKPIPAGHVVLRRRVALADGERRTVRFSCPRGTVAIEPALPEFSAITFVVRDLSQYRRPTSRFHVAALRAPTAADGVLARGRIYVLCGPPAGARR
jgi:hypothetical protein